MSWLEDNWERLLSVGLGAYAGSQGSEDQVVTQRPYMYPGQEQGLTDVLDLARQEYEAGPQSYYPGSTVAPLDQNVIDGQNQNLASTDIQQQLADIAGQSAGQLAQGGAGRIEGFRLPDQIAGAGPAQRIAGSQMPGAPQAPQRPGGLNMGGQQASQGAFSAGTPQASAALREAYEASRSGGQQASQGAFSAGTPQASAALQASRAGQQQHSSSGVTRNQWRNMSPEQREAYRQGDRSMLPGGQQSGGQQSGGQQPGGYNLPGRETSNVQMGELGAAPQMGQLGAAPEMGQLGVAPEMGQLRAQNTAGAVAREDAMQRITRENLPGQVGGFQGPGQIDFTQGENAQALDRVGALNVPGRVGSSQAVGEVASAGPLPGQIGFGIDQGLQDATLNPVLRELQEKILPSTDLAATSQGAFGGTRHQLMRNEAAEDATQKAMESLSRANLEARGQSIGQRAGDINAVTARRGQDVTQRGQTIGQRVSNMNAQVGQRNADLNANVAARQQDITQRGQDYGDRSNIRNAQLTQRGQDINSSLQARGQDIGQRQTDINAMLGQRGQDVTQRQADQSFLSTQRGQDVNQRGQDINADLTGRGQDLSYLNNEAQLGLAGRGQDLSYLNNTMQGQLAGRGQDLSYLNNTLQGQLTGRGQDLSYLNNQANVGLQNNAQNITQRGQDINAALTGRGQDVNMYGTDVNAGLTQRNQDMNFLNTQRSQDINQNSLDNQYNLGLLNNYTGQRSTDINAQLQGRGQDINQNQIQNSAMYNGINSMPAAMGMQLIPGQTMMNIGQQRTGYNQALIDEDVNRFNFNQQAPIDSLSLLQQRMTLSGAPMGTTTNYQGQSGNWLNMLGGGMAGNMLYNSFQPQQQQPGYQPFMGNVGGNNIDSWLGQF